MSVSTESERRIDQLEQRVDELEAKVEEKDERIEELEGVCEENQQLQETVEDQEDRIDELETKLQGYREHNEKDKAALKRRVTDLESQATEGTDRDTAPDDAADEVSQQENTPLTQIVQLPEPLAETELTANQKRARFVATDILDYATKAPAGFVVTSSDIRKILAAKEDGTPHTETVSRVINFLDRFGQDDVTIVKRHGIRRVAFTEEAANRYHHADAHDQEEITGVVMGAATG